MRRQKIFIIALLFTALYVNASGQNKTYPFEIQKTGQGKQAVIFIPGFACSGEVWNETKSHFEKDFTCFTLTMAGFAGVKPQENPAFQNWEESVATFIKNNKINKPIVVGHSLGGCLAMALAADYPDLILKIIVVDALPCLFALTNPSFKTKEKNDCSETVNQITALSDDQFYQMQKMSISRLIADTSYQKMIINWSVKSDRTTFAEMFCDFSNTDLRNKIMNIKCPSLILLEAYFSNFKPAINEQFKELKDANIQYANKGLHFIMNDDKEWYFVQLNNFLITR